MQRTKYLGSIQVYSVNRGRVALWKWDGTQYVFQRWTEMDGNIQALYKVNFRVSAKDIVYHVQ